MDKTLLDLVFQAQKETTDNLRARDAQMAAIVQAGCDSLGQHRAGCKGIPGAHEMD